MSNIYYVKTVMTNRESRVGVLAEYQGRFENGNVLIGIH